ncbi:dihydroorotase family protein [Bradyrhizobium sp. dw_78]|uniref:dihydroorotase n=1 Tax=Bradyrhizobium sp. dw_78 TaxID=2719793 RepID=UPI001BD2355B|nr:dihydroorotase family protein [Bradyrhizobium sp. dw_78]
MSYEKVVRGTVVTPEASIPGGWIAIDGETIREIGEGKPPAALEVHDFGQSWIVPGGIDAQTHAGSYWGLAGLEPTSRAAVCGGITTMVEMPFDNPIPLSTMELFHAKVKAIENLSYCDVALYGTCAPHQDTDEMYRLAEAGVCAFKISVCESHPVRFPRIPADQQLAMLQACAELGLPLGIHNEDQEIVRYNTQRMRETGKEGLAVHSACRPEAAELAATALFLELAAVTGAQAHIVHISTPRGFELLDGYRKGGHKTTGEICVHYLLFDPESDGEKLGALIKVNPPIRPGVREALWDQIRNDRVQCISSDHSTMSRENKLGGSIFDAGPGVPGIESLMPAFFTGVEAHEMDAPAAVARFMSEKPAKLFGLWPKKGAIAVGADADLAVLQPGRFIYDSSKAHDDVNWSPFDGMTFTAKVASTFVRGRQVWNGADVIGQKDLGQFVPRQQSPS